MKRGSLIGCAILAAAWSFQPAPVSSQGLVSEGDVVVTQFSGLRLASGLARPNPDGAVARVFSLSSPGQAPDGSVVENPGLLFTVTARDVGQVFGIAMDDAAEPNIYLAASSAYGVYRDDGAWADGMWGDDGGPGTVWKLDAERGYAPVAFADVAPENGGAGLGDLAFDPWHGQILVSDLESGLIHRVHAETGEVLESFDHGTQARPAFFDAGAGEQDSLPDVPRDAEAAPRYEDCEAAGASGEPATFQEAPECWNFADFRRRVWGLGVVRDPGEGTVRVYYAVWGGAALGSADWADAGEETRTSVWSVGLGESGAFDTSDIRRELVLHPAQSPEGGETLAMAPVTDIAFTGSGGMVLVERAVPWLATADRSASRASARVFAAERDDEGRWMPVEQELGEANGAVPTGGAGVGHGFTASGEPGESGGTIWLSLEGVCDDEGICVGGKRRAHAVEDAAAGLAAVAEDVMFPEGETTGDGAPAAYAVVLQDSGMRAGSLGDVAVNQGLDPSMRIAEAGPPLETEQATAEPEDAAPAPAEDPEDAEEQADAPDAEPKSEDLQRGDLDEAEEGGEVTARAAPGDLALRMSGPDLCEPGEVCAFEVTLENEGDNTFAGPLVVTAMPTASNLTLDTGASEGWSCEMAGTAVMCRHADLALDAGEDISLSLPLNLPDGFRAPRLEVCTSLTWLAQSGRERIRAVQAGLTREGYDPGPVDGAMGPRTRSEIEKAEAALDLPETGEISANLVEQLFGEGSYLTGDGDGQNDRDCFPVTIDLPAGVQAQPAPRQQAPRQSPQAGYHSYDRSAYHEPSTSAPAEWHGPRSSWFHDQRGSAGHDWRSSGATGTHSLRLSGFHRAYDSRAHDSRSTGIAEAHWPALSQFHSRFDSGVHDGVRTRLVPPHDPNTSYMLPMSGEREFDLFVPERRAEAGETTEMAQNDLSPSTIRRPRPTVPQINTNRNLRTRQMDINRALNNERLQDSMSDTRERQRRERQIYNPFADR